MLCKKVENLTASTIGSNDLKQEYLDMKKDLTPIASPQPSNTSTSSANTNDSKSTASTSTKAKTVPKWLQKSLFNKK